MQESLKFIEAHSYIEASTPKYTKDDHTRCLKQEFAKWECIINDILCKETANYQLELHLEDPKEHKYLLIASFNNSFFISIFFFIMRMFDKLFIKYIKKYLLNTKEAITTTLL